MGKENTNLLRELPSVSAFLNSEEGITLCTEFGEGITKLMFRELINTLRQEIRSGKRSEIPSLPKLEAFLRPELLRLSKPVGRAAINATGILLHTGLGRAPLAQSAIEAMNTARGYSVLQVDPLTGERSLREEKIERMLKELTGCEAATVLNNNAAATFIILNVLAGGKEVVISRGQLIEIGGSYRLPEVMAQSGAVLREVGTTNRTHLRDYEKAIGENTGAILHVHPSNYRIHGFSGTPSLEDLCALGRSKELPVIADLGSGALVSLSEFGLKDCVNIGGALGAGAAVTCSSGDKLISGPQAGIICGKEEVVERIRKNPYARMFRVCRLTLAALEATLVHYVNGDYREHLPLYQMLALSVDSLEERGKELITKLEGLQGIAVSLADDASFVGGGALPDQAIPTKVVQIELKDAQNRNRFSANVSKSLRLNVPPVFCRVKDELLIFDMRSLHPGDLETLAKILRDTIPREISQ